ncbi:hypothetical protein ACFSJU_14910 [Paradesertivirga mongoliensis]|uniref:KOW domain-containing protein n=1 Tax=Paradesertivirga mongoliensis TaxID=2100740 RepID=A0ABW4ZNX9_9SPHI|nr:hypothetical protein [Pedobacter mongoliensis]
MKQYSNGDRVKAIAGRLKGRTGEFIKNYSSVFPEYCRVKLDLKGREREHKTVMVLKTEIQLHED